MHVSSTQEWHLALSAKLLDRWVMSSHQEIEHIFTELLSICERDRQSEGLHLIYIYRSIARFRSGKYSSAVQDARTALEINER